ncbi:GRAM domain-containing protein [Planococcus sp. CAU13]|uniref:GRAM domain-containing protein n=1 Tax=Planococcus sp. CAU13 TaxID=1541197 RepID=UPI00052FF627|nr:GRAM domain-containing protein [Planococcus sp. CAU13]
MAHPANLLKELKMNKPNAHINHWVFGVLHTSRCNKVAGLKGLLAVSEESLIFRSGSGAESHTLEAPLEEVKSIEADLQGTVHLIIHFTDGGHMEMSFVSRGNAKEFFEFLKTQSRASKEQAIAVKKTELS